MVVLNWPSWLQSSAWTSVSRRRATGPRLLSGAAWPRTALFGPLEVNLVVDPAHAGDNDLHLFLLDRWGSLGGRTPSSASRFAASSKQIGPLRFTARGLVPVTSPSSARTSRSGGGDWQLRLEARRGEFDIFYIKPFRIPKTKGLRENAQGLLFNRCCARGSSHGRLQPTSSGPPNEAPADSFFRPPPRLRVPTERDNPLTAQRSRSSTSGRPPPSSASSPSPAGRAAVTMVKLARQPRRRPTASRSPSGSRSVTWTGGAIGPRRVRRVRNERCTCPTSPAPSSCFPAVCETYSNGEVVRWIGAAGRRRARSPRRRSRPRQAEAWCPHGDHGRDLKTESEEGEDDSEDRANLALGLGAAGLVAGLAALGMGFRRRRR